MGFIRNLFNECDEKQRLLSVMSISEEALNQKNILLPNPISKRPFEHLLTEGVKRKNV